MPPHPPPQTTHGVLFDVGYALLDEAPRFRRAVKWLARYLAERGVPVPAGRLAAAYEEACLAPDPGEPSLLVQTARRTGVPPDLALRQRREMPWDSFGRMPAYPGARAALRRLRAAGVRVGVLANQPASAREDLEEAGLLAMLDGCWLSDVVGLRKPDPAFFRVALAAWGMPAGRIAYVGDRPDNDVGPANDLGLHSVRLRQGPHALQPSRGPREEAAFEAGSLAEAADHLLRWAAPPGDPP